MSADADRLARALARVDGDHEGETAAETALLAGDLAGAARLAGDDRAGLFVKGAVALAEGRAVEAGALARRSLAADGGAEAHALLALAGVDPETTLAAAARLSSRRAWPWVLLARLRESSNDIGGARLAVEEALRREKSPWLWAELARVEELAGVIPAALRAAERAIAGEPSLEHRRLRAHLLECWREHDEAAAEYARALKSAPGDAGLLFSRSRVLSAAGRMKDALADARAAEAASGGDENLAAWRLQVELLAGGEKAVARDLAARLKTAGPDQKGRLRFLQGYALMRAKKWPAAAKAFAALAADCVPGDALERRASFYRTVALAMGAGKPAKSRDKVVFLGLGADPPYTATMAMLKAVAGADVVFNNIMGDEMFEFLRALHRDVRAVNYHQDNDEDRLATMMLKECSAGRRVAFVTRGNAFVYGPLGALMLERARAKKWAWRCEPSASSWEFITGRLAPDPGARRGMAVLDSRSAKDGLLLDAGLPTTVFFNIEAGDEAVTGACRALAGQRRPDSPALVLDHVVGQQPQNWTAAQVEERRARLSVSAIVHYPAVDRSPA